MEFPNTIIDYRQYQKLSSQQRKNIINNSKQQEIYRKPIPIQGLSFPQQNWFDFYVKQTQTFILSQPKITLIKLQTYRWRSQQNKIKGVIILFHGLTSHINEGSYLAKIFAQNGYQTVGFDQRGFGKSQGLKGYLQNFQINMQDSVQFLQKIQIQYPNQSIFVSGLSLGGLISFNLSISYSDKIKGTILMAPALKSYQGNFSLFCAKTLSFLAPKLQIPKIGRGSKRGSKNPNVSQLRKEDQYRYTQNPYITTLKNVIVSMAKAQQNFEKLNTPLFLVQGIKDNSVDPQGAINLFKYAKNKNKQLLLYGNLWHNIWQQEQIYDIMQRLIKWLNKFQ